MFLEEIKKYKGDIYAYYLTRYLSALIEYNELLSAVEKTTMNEIFIHHTSFSKQTKKGDKKYEYVIPFEQHDGDAKKISRKQYEDRRPTWENYFAIKNRIEELECVINRIEKALRRNILTPPGQPSLEEIRQSMQCQNRHMQELTKEHERDNYRGYFEKGNVHASGKVFASRAELLIYEEIKNCGLQVIYEYNFVDEKYHVVHRPDFYGFRGNMPYIIEFFGMMETREYRESALGKIKKYAECGFTFEKNMIAFSTKQSNIINMKTVHTVLKNFSVYGIIPENIVEIDVIAS